MKSSLDFFVGGVPAGAIFSNNLNGLLGILDSPAYEGENSSDVLYEVCSISLVAYFESFCKNQYASIINIFPEILSEFTKTSTAQVSLDIWDIIKFNFDVKNKIGFLLAENYDFGTAKTINNLYFQLLSVTIFSKDEAKVHSAILNDRNLLVHHGGILTTKYRKQKTESIMDDNKNRIFFDSIVIDRRVFEEWYSFYESMAIKILKVCYDKVRDFVSLQNISLTDERKEALEYLLWFPGKYL